MDSGPGEMFLGWSWLAGIGGLIFLGVLLLPWFFFLLSLQSLLEQVSPPNRRMNPGLVWLNFIPLFNLGWLIYTVMKVRDSVAAEFQSRGWAVDGDLGYNVGLTAGVLLIAGFFISWIPFIGWVLPLAFLICWIIYWLKMADLKHRLEMPPVWGRPGAYPAAYPTGYLPQVPPYAPRYQDPYAPPYPQPYPPAAQPAPSPYQPLAEQPDPELAPWPEPPEQPGVTAAAAPATDAQPAATAEPATVAGTAAIAGAAVGAEAAADQAEAAMVVGLAAGEGATKDIESPEIQCAACGSKIDQGDRFCRSCGIPLP